MTSDVERRLHEHNTKKGHWTSSFQPWEIIALEEFGCRKDASAREAFLKSRAGIGERQRLFDRGEVVERP
jgi:predicted GIY-YIG superfamily endonuclease